MFDEISHIGIIVSDLEAAVSQWQERFGFVEVERLHVEVEGVRSVFLSTGHKRGEGMVVELLTPLDPEDRANPIARRLQEVGEGVYHLAVFAADPAAESRRLADAGVRVVDLPPVEAGQMPRAFVHPREANGLPIEVLSKADL